MGNGASSTYRVYVEREAGTISGTVISQNSIENVTTGILNGPGTTASTIKLNQDVSGTTPVVDNGSGTIFWPASDKKQGESSVLCVVDCHRQ
jgi:hypothetical protein